MGADSPPALEANDVVFRVSDTGIGILEEHQRAIFDLFRQGDGSETRRYGGTGVGLYIVRQLVAQMRGSVAVSRPGAGATFTVTLPRVLETRDPGDDRVPHSTVGAFRAA